MTLGRRSVRLQCNATKNQVKLVIDANVLFSALLKDGLTAELISHENLKLYSPEFILEEFGKYEEEILERTSRSSDEFSILLKSLGNVIEVVPKEEYDMLMSEAAKFSPR